LKKSGLFERFSFEETQKKAEAEFPSYYIP
jgi:hypothetical protein